MKYYLFIAVCIVFMLRISFSKCNSDSLRLVLNTFPADTNRIKTLSKLACTCSNSNIDSANLYVSELLSLSQKLNYPQGEATAYNIMGNMAAYAGKYDSAMVYYIQSIEINKANGFKKGIANCYVNIGNVCYYQGDIEKTLAYNLKSLDINHQLCNKSGMASCNNNIGNIYYYKSDYEQALLHFKKALDLYSEQDDKNGIARAYHNIGNVYNQLDNYDLSLEYYLNSYLLNKENNNIRALALVSNNIGNLYRKQGSMIKAREYINMAIRFSGEINAKDWQMEAYKSLSKLDSAKRDYSNALHNYKIYTALKDSFYNEKNKKHLNELQAKYKSEKAERENRLHKLEIQKQRTLIIVFIAAIVILIIKVFIFIFRAKAVRKTAKTLQQQERTIHKQETELNKRKAEILVTRLQHHKRELTSNAMFLVQSNEKNKRMIEELKAVLPEFLPRNKRKIDVIIKKYQVDKKDDAWSEFEMRFEHVHQDFYTNLSKQFPALTPNERRLSAFLRLNMTTKEIASITYTSEQSVNVARSRLRQKLSLPRHENIVNFLAQF